MAFTVVVAKGCGQNGGKENEGELHGLRMCVYEDGTKLPNLPRKMQSDFLGVYRHT